MNLVSTWRLALALIMAGSMSGGFLLSSATKASADYGSGAQYQIEISDNCNGPQLCEVAQGDGIWLWIELNANGTGDYAGSDCIHNSPIAPTGALVNRGDITSWSVSAGTLTINGVKLLGGTVPVTITVPATYGHYVQQTTQIFPDFLPIPGQAQVQVAP